MTNLGKLWGKEEAVILVQIVMSDHALACASWQHLVCYILPRLSKNVMTNHLCNYDNLLAKARIYRA